MAGNKKNLLEAFRNAGEVPLPNDEPDEALQPLSAEEESLLAEETRLQADLSSGGRRPWRNELPEMPVWLPWVAGGGLVLVVAIALGKGFTGGEDVNASEAGDAASERQAESPPPAGIVPADPDRAPVRPASESTPATTPATTPASGAEPVSALMDPANVWTVVVITYSQSASGAEDLAWATHDHLRDEGIPVHTPVEIGSQIVVLAGAAPRSSDLADLRARIEGLSRRGKANVYQGVYSERIDKFVKRY